MAFVKLDTGILNSTLWIARDERDIFITALLMAKPFELEESTPAIEPHSITPTGFVVPPGWYGFVESSGPGIVRQALVDEEAGNLALERLGQPDPQSRSLEYDGRRMVRVNNGFIVLNYMKYRDYDHGAADRMRRLRARKKKASKDVQGDTTASVTPSRLRVTSRIADADADAEESKPQRHRVVDKSGAPQGAALKGTRLDKDWVLPKAWGDWALKKHPAWTPEQVREIGEEFRDHWIAVAGRAGVKLDWFATWRNRVRFLMRAGNGAGRRAGPAWWSTDETIIAEGKRHGLEPRAGESMGQFKFRVQEAVAGNSK